MSTIENTKEQTFKTTCVTAGTSILGFHTENDAAAQIALHSTICEGCAKAHPKPQLHGIKFFIR